jgi:hypothetical protein
MSNLISPLLFQSVPFGSETAYRDFLGQLGSWHIELAKSTGTSYRLLDDLKDNLEGHAAMHNEVADALGITKVADLTSFDLTDETSWISFLFLEASDLTRFRTAAGL